MIITIITSTFNCIDELKVTLESVRENHKSGDFGIQWIIVDGCSTDGTIELVNENLKLVSYFKSEPDNGIYDAWNKACEVIDGDWVVFLGAGDTLNHRNMGGFCDMLKEQDVNTTKLVYGNVELVDSNFRVLKKYAKVLPNDWSNGRPSLPCHQGVFQHRTLFKGRSTFDCNYKIAADSKFLLLSMSKTKMTYLNIDIATMEIMGVSTNPKHILKVRSELTLLRRDLNLKIPLSKLFYFNFKCFCKYFLVRFFGTRPFKFLARLYCLAFSKDYIY